MDFIDELTWRGILHQSTDPSLGDRLRAEPFTLYIGFDPTADSLHVGSLLQILNLVRAQRAGHKPIAVVGGATGMVGDPSGKSEERKLLSLEQLQANVAGIREQLGRVLDFGAGAQLVNNFDWFSGFPYLDFLREVGKHFSVNMMLAKDSVRARLEDRAQGISYTEFSYMLIQSYDFLVLHDKFNCRLQVGGSDQWGNITAGIDLIRRMRGKEAYGVTTPLITDAAGRKFGKTEEGAIWLAVERTSVYDFFQYFLRVADADAGRFLRYFTFLDQPTIAALEETVKAAPEKREAQRVLAREVTTLVHGAEQARKAEEAAQAAFGGETVVDLKALPRGKPIAAGALPMPLVAVLAESGLCKSKGDARRMIEQGGISVNDARISDVARLVDRSDLREGGLVLLQKGKREKLVVEFS